MSSRVRLARVPPEGHDGHHWLRTLTGVFKEFPVKCYCQDGEAEAGSKSEGHVSVSLEVLLPPLPI